MGLKGFKFMIIMLHLALHVSVLNSTEQVPRPRRLAVDQVDLEDFGATGEDVADGRCIGCIKNKLFKAPQVVNKLFSQNQLQPQRPTSIFRPSTWFSASQVNNQRPSINDRVKLLQQMLQGFGTRFQSPFTFGTGSQFYRMPPSVQTIQLSNYPSQVYPLSIHQSGQVPIAFKLHFNKDGTIRGQLLNKPGQYDNKKQQIGDLGNKIQNTKADVIDDIVDGTGEYVQTVSNAKDEVIRNIKDKKDSIVNTFDEINDEIAEEIDDAIFGRLIEIEDDVVETTTPDSQQEAEQPEVKETSELSNDTHSRSFWFFKKDKDRESFLFSENKLEKFLNRYPELANKFKKLLNKDNQLRSNVKSDEAAAEAAEDSLNEIESSDSHHHAKSKRSVMINPPSTLEIDITTTEGSVAEAAGNTAVAEARNPDVEEDAIETSEEPIEATTNSIPGEAISAESAESVESSDESEESAESVESKDKVAENAVQSDASKS